MKFKMLFIVALLSSHLYAETIRVAVAANVSYAIADLIQAFNQNFPDTKVQVTLAGSGKLTAQIKNGAPYQLFLSADMRYPQALYDEGLATTRPIVYAQGALAYFSTKEQDFSQGMALLKKKYIKKIAVANPKTAPYGKATEEALKKAGIYDNTRAKYVYGESISQTVSYVLSAADMGIVAKSLLYSPHMLKYKEGVHWESLPLELYTPIKQGMVILKEGESSPVVASFYAFMLSKKAYAVLQKFGYTLP